MVSIGDRISSGVDSLLFKRGDVGTVVDMYTPIHATGCWYIEVVFDGHDHRTRLSYGNFESL